ncbi:Hypothetical predicted protein [Octopus vulgaris]|uniref:Uncharacterized protein n=1 Tax=Octopus vulgaris TaxID=6645 RepID=A0AA36AQ33_OCTVU|nr:Hypothetical predicted protein [Octopus vulgaris]
MWKSDLKLIFDFKFSENGLQISRALQVNDLLIFGIHCFLLTLLGQSSTEYDDGGKKKKDYGYFDNDVMEVMAMAVMR